jgi:hypothetical protein
MTAEIIIMNKLAIALAADSAVTISQERGRDKNPKIFNTVNKLFTLSKYQPVGVMIYGGAGLNGVPWESVVKTYRRYLGKRNFPTLREYTNNFLAFLEADMLPNATQEHFFKASAYGYFTSIKGQVDKEVKGQIEQKGQITEAEIKKIVESKIDEELSRWNAFPYLPSVDENYSEEIIRKYEKVIEDVIQLVFERLPIGSQHSDKLKRICGLLFSKNAFARNASGIVIAGFGDKDIFPSFVELMVEGVANCRLKYREVESGTISDDKEALIKPLAQREAVVGFMEGIEPDLRGLFDSYLTDLINGLSSGIVENLVDLSDEKRAKLKEKLDGFGKGLLEKFRKDVQNRIRSSHVSPIIETVRFLPKDELAAMAETLVNLTSFKRRISMTAETVGGPIDVAVISKGDGFIWIKRKHYFRPELNPHFAANYLADSGEV